MFCQVAESNYPDPSYQARFNEYDAPGTSLLLIRIQCSQFDEPKFMDVLLKMDTVWGCFLKVCSRLLDLLDWHHLPPSNNRNRLNVNSDSIFVERLFLLTPISHHINHIRLVVGLHQRKTRHSSNPRRTSENVDGCNGTIRCIGPIFSVFSYLSNRMNWRKDEWVWMRRSYDLCYLINSNVSIDSDRQKSSKCGHTLRYARLCCTKLHSSKVALFSCKLFFFFNC